MSPHFQITVLDILWQIKVFNFFIFIIFEIKSHVVQCLTLAAYFKMFPPNIVKKMLCDCFRGLKWQTHGLQGALLLHDTYFFP